LTTPALKLKDGDSGRHRPGLGLSADNLPPQMDRAGWPELRRIFTTAFKTRTRDQWTANFRDVDA